MTRTSKKIELFTGKGDGGRTSLLDGQRVSKGSHRIELLGLLDEVSAALGLARASVVQDASRQVLVEVQRDIYRLMAELAGSKKGKSPSEKFDPERVRWLEAQILKVTPAEHLVRGFILPGDNLPGAALDMARAVTRRVERRVVRESERRRRISGTALSYLNRLSSLLFALELYELGEAGLQATPAKNESEGKSK